jgi:allophanate hydrolase
MGGFEGRAIATGDRLNICRRGSQTAPSLQLPQAPPLDPGPIRVLAGPQRDYFTDAAWNALVSNEYTVTREADRMGLRLDGPLLEHDPALGADIVSDAVTPGAIQVPGDGRPIVLLADCQTVGGYPKIATVIHADLRRLGHLLPGQKLHFSAVTIDEALAARRNAAHALAASIGGIRLVAAEFNLDALYGANLIDGVIDAGTAY